MKDGAFNYRLSTVRDLETGKPAKIGLHNRVIIYFTHSLGRCVGLLPIEMETDRRNVYYGFKLKEAHTPAY